LRLIPPVGYLDFLAFSANRRSSSRLRGIQEETTALGVPCLTLRENTERPITISEGTNLARWPPILPKSVAVARDTLAGKGKPGRIPPLWTAMPPTVSSKILLKVVPRAKAS